MVGVPPRRHGRTLKYPFDEVRRGQPVFITVSNKDGGAEKEYDSIRVQAGRYARRHGKHFVTRLKERLTDGSLKLEIHYNGRRK